MFKNILSLDENVRILTVYIWDMLKAVISKCIYLR